MNQYKFKYHLLLGKLIDEIGEERTQDIAVEVNEAWKEVRQERTKEMGKRLKFPSRGDKGVGTGIN